MSYTTPHIKLHKQLLFIASFFFVLLFHPISSNAEIVIGNTNSGKAVSGTTYPVYAKRYSGSANAKGTVTHSTKAASITYFWGINPGTMDGSTVNGFMLYGDYNSTDTSACDDVEAMDQVDVSLVKNKLNGISSGGGLNYNITSIKKNATTTNNSKNSMKNYYSSWRFV